LFLPAGIAKLTNLAGPAALIASKGLPGSELLALITALLEIAASLALVVGWRTRWAALALAGFTLLAAALFHDFWAASAAQRMAQSQAFFKNLAIAGGLLVLAASGPGAFSLPLQRRAS
jgi:putative oxidoreductase